MTIILISINWTKRTIELIILTFAKQNCHFQLFFFVTVRSGKINKQRVLIKTKEDCHGRRKEKEKHLKMCRKKMENEEKLMEWEKKSDN